MQIALALALLQTLVCFLPLSLVRERSLSLALAFSRTHDAHLLQFLCSVFQYVTVAHGLIENRGIDKFDSGFNTIQFTSCSCAAIPA